MGEFRRHHHVRNEGHELPAPLSDVGHLLPNLCLDIPREYDQVIRSGGGNHVWMQDGDMRAREKMPLLVGTTVNCIVQKICPHPR